MITFNELVQRRIVELLLEVPGNRAKLKSAGIKYHIPVDVVAVMSFNSRSYHIILNFKAKYVNLSIHRDLFDYVVYQFAGEDCRNYAIFEDVQKSSLIINKLYISHFYISSDSILVFKNPINGNKLGLFECSTDMKKKFNKIKLEKTDSSKDMSKQNTIKKEEIVLSDDNPISDKVLVDRKITWKNKKDDTHDEFGFEIRKNFGFRD